MENNQRFLLKLSGLVHIRMLHVLPSMSDVFCLLGQSVQIRSRSAQCGRKIAGESLVTRDGMVFSDWRNVTENCEAAGKGSSQMFLA